MADNTQRHGWIRSCGLWGVAIAIAAVVPIAVAVLTIDNARTTRESLRVVVTPPSVNVSAVFDRIGFNIRKIHQGSATVPRVLLAALPRELPHISNTGQRKALFLTSMLPLVLQVNEIIEAERERLLTLSAKVSAGLPLNGEEQDWLKHLQRKYRVEEQDFARLLRRVNTIPPSLALAQAAIESGWGTSRFAQEGNAIFGQWTWGEDGMIPMERPEGSSHRIRTFDHLVESVAAYARNLNTHPAYKTLRTMREALAREGKAITGPALVAALDQYSERRGEYTHDVMSVIRGNRLSRFDNASLEYSALHGAEGAQAPNVFAAR